MASVTTTPTTAKTSTVVPALYKQALAQAKLDLAAQSQPIKDEITQNDATATQRTQDASDNATALSKILGNIGPQVQDAYSQASDRQGVLAKGFSDGMQAALNKSGASDNAFLAKQGAPKGQQIDPNKSKAAGDVLYGLGGYVPASTFNREGAAFTAAADMLPGTALLKGQEMGKAISMSAQAADTLLQNRLTELAGQLPGNAESNYAKLQSLAIENAKFAEQVKNDKFDQAYKTATQKLNVAKYETSTKLSVARINLDAKKFAAQQMQSNRDYGIKLANLGIAQAKDQRAAIAAQYKLENGGYTPTQINKFNGLLQDGLNHIKVQNNPDGSTVYLRPDPKDKTGVKMIPTTYVEFVKQAVAHGVPPSIAVDRADKFFPPEARPQGPGALDFALGTTSGGGPGRSADVLQAANMMLGTPYVWGGSKVGQGLDCSGFIQQAFAQIGVTLPRTTYAQVKAGKAVKLNQLQPGDAVFTEPGKNGPNHVGLYIGNGQVQESPHTGDVNKVIPLKDFLTGGFVAARRYLNG